MLPKVVQVVEYRISASKKELVLYVSKCRQKVGVCIRHD